MPNSPHSLVNYIRDVIGAWKDDPRSDAELMAQFAENRDQAAFKILVGRHGAMVWRTCRSILGNTPDAEDVFQSTFMALTRKAGLFPVKSLAGWLHQVTRRAALDAGANLRRRQSLEQQMPSEMQSEANKDTGRTEWYGILDEELVRLPEKLRVPLVLHFLEERTQDEVARVLGCSRSSVQRRLTRGEAILRKRLEKRGVTLGAGSIATLLGNTASAPAMPLRLIENTTRAAVAFHAGTHTGVIADTAEKLLRSLAIKGTARKLWWAMLICAGSLGLGGAGVVAWKMFGVGSDVITSVVPDTPKTTTLSVAARSQNRRVDLYGDPLPEGAVARIGTVRFRGEGEGLTRWHDAHCNRNLEAGVAISSDGKMLVQADGNNIYFWDIITGRQLQKIAMQCTSIALTPDNKLLIVHDQKCRCIRLLDTATGESVEESLRGLGAAVFAPDGKTVACMCETDTRGSFYLYEVGTRKLLRQIGQKLDGYAPTSAQFSRDGQYFACAYVKQRSINGPETMVELSNVETGEKRAALKYPEQVTQMIFSPEGNIITAGKDGVLRIRDAKTGKQLRQLGAADGVPTVLAFLPDRKTLLVACTGQIRRWNVVSGQEMRPAMACKGLLRPILLSADGTRLIEQIGNALSLWDVSTGKETGPSADASRSFMDNVVFSPDGTMLATEAESIGGIDEWDNPMQKPGMPAFYLWDSATGKRVGSLLVPTGARAWGWAGISPHSVIAWPFRNVILAHARYVYEGEPLCTEKQTFGLVRWEITPSASDSSGKIVHSAIETDFLRPDHRFLASKKEGGQNFELLDITTDKKLPFMPDRFRPGLSSLSADHRILASQSFDESAITLWDTTTGHELYSLDLPVIAADDPEEKPKFGWLVGFSPDARLIATFNPKTAVITLWERASGQVRWHLSLPEKCKYAEVVFSPDSSLLAASCRPFMQEKKSIQIWDLTTGRVCQCFDGHRASRDSLEIAFSSDGRRLASAGKDYTALIWEVKHPSTAENAKQPLDGMELKTLKTALADIDAPAAYQAIGKLRQVPEQAASLAAECLQSDTPSIETKQAVQEVKRLIAELDSNDFRTRIKASEKLSQMLREEKTDQTDVGVENLLHQALAGKSSVEMNHAITQLLDQKRQERQLKGGGVRSRELTRMFRAIELLELIHNASAREVLQKVVATPPRPEVQCEAAAALKRLSNPSSAVVP